MTRPSWRFRAAVTLLPALGLTAAFSSGCEIIANLQTRKVAANDAGGGGPVLTDLSACEITGTGKGRLRFGNLVPNEERIDICLRPTAESSFANVKPFFQSQAAATCQGGMQYKDVTKAFEVPADTYEIKIVKAGSTSCEVPEIASLPQVIVGDDKPTATYVFGDGQSKPTIRRFVEDRPSNVTASLIRVLVTTQELGDSVDFGLGFKKVVPQKIERVYLAQLPYGNTVPSGTSDFKPTENGYVNEGSNGGSPFFGIGKSGGQMEIGLARKMVPGSAFTFFLTGRSDTPDFPLELFACEETASRGALAACSAAPPLTVAVQTLGVNLTGVFGALEPQRRPAVPKAIASANADVVCVTDIWSDKDKAAVIEAARSKFPYSYYASTNFSTPIQNSTDLSGAEVPPPAAAACSSATNEMNALVDCLKTHCSNESGSATGATEAATAPSYNPASCMSDHCQELIGQMAIAHPACWTCTFGQFNSYEPMSEIRNICGKTPAPPALVADTFFRGNSPTLVLSRYPIEAPEHNVLPGTGWRPGITRTPLKLDNGATLDFYCAQPTSVFDQCLATFPFTIPRFGSNADGSRASDCVAGYVNQQKLVMTRIREWISARSGPTRAKAIIAGAFAAGPAIGDTITSVQPENFAVLSGIFSLGIPVGHQPECTQCADNAARGQDPNSSAAANFWTTHNLLWNIPHTDVRSMQVNFKEATVDVQAVTGGAVPASPISVNYGLRSEIRVAP